jgi:hypothetical protein
MKPDRKTWTGKGIWLKGNIHTHTTSSDGRLNTVELAREYKRHNYDFLYITDHDKRTVCADKTAKPLMIPAEEIALAYKSHVYHFVCLGLKDEWKAKSFHSPMQLLARARREKVFVVQGHPYWCGIPSQSCVFPGKLTCPGVEVYNTVCDLTRGKGYSSVHWDDLLDAGHRVLGFAVDDTHWAAHIAGGWIMVKAADRSPGAILKAIRKGNFYSSQGPALKSITIRNREIRIACSPVSRINIMANRYRGCCFFAKTGKLKGARWIIPQGYRYVRVELVDKSGKMAWSNPIYFAH